MSTQVNKSTILIVDDDPVQRRILQAAIENMGYMTWCCENGEAAIEALSGNRSSDIASVVLDLMMPGVDGHGVLEFMREHEIHKPVIVQTAQGGMETAIKAHGFETGNHGDYEPGRRFYFHDADGIEYEVVQYN